MKANYRKAQSILRSKLIASPSVILVRLCFQRKALCLGHVQEERRIHFIEWSLGASLPGGAGQVFLASVGQGMDALLPFSIPDPHFISKMGTINK